MHRFVLSALAVACAAVMALAEGEKGAKALFFDPATGAAVSPVRPAHQPRSAPATEAHREAAPPAANAGLMYYIERQTSGGAVERVSPATVFHSGDRIRIAFQSNIDGRLMIAQCDSAGTSSVLFPDPRVIAGDDRIRARQETVVPAAPAWFRFDVHPGEERLLVMLTPEGARNTPFAANSATDREPVAQLDARRTQELAQSAHAQGSKALVIEIDDTSSAPAAYVVHRPGEGSSNSIITTEIVLQHR
jgi:hypothetical protein